MRNLPRPRPDAKAFFPVANLLKWSEIAGSTQTMATYTPPRFLTELLHARSPSGYEAEAQAVFERYVKPAADTYAGDALGNRIATLNPGGNPTLMLAGHMDELSFHRHLREQGWLYLF